MSRTGGFDLQPRFLQAIGRRAVPSRCAAKPHLVYRNTGLSEKEIVWCNGLSSEILIGVR